MYSTTLRKVGGSIMLAVPPALLETLSIGSGTKVGLTVKNGSILVKPCRKPHYTLAELIAECDENAEPPSPDETWLNAPPVGKEIL
ncbi:MAG: antitoxin [Sutterellaceae bacterium]|nr:antitoxin [Sutterellaceae bacterium]MDD7441155.1 antitoxin [Sutterellaceae bacterium]MDY2868479.1 antitoxin [Mesosutterella sp.]